MSLDNHGLIDLGQLEKRDYSRLLLNKNPFPSTAVPGDVPLTTADRKPVLRRFLDTMSSLSNENASTVTVLLGDYGTGKSHLLKLFKVSVNSKLLLSEKPILAIYVKSPGKSMRDLLLYILDDLGREFLSRLSNEFLFKFISKIGTSKYLKSYEEFKLTKVSQIPEYLENSRSIELVNAAQSELLGLKNSDLIRSFLFLSHPDLGSIAWRWFIGSSLSRDEKNTLGLTSTIDDSQFAEQILNAFILLLHSVGVYGLVLLIDELEAISLIHGLSRGVYQHALRHVIDANSTGLAMVFAITPTEWGKLTETPSALERRLAGSVVDLAPFVKKDIRELIAKYMSLARTDEFKQKKEISEIFPFNEEAVDYIFSVTKGIPSKVIELCRDCVTRFATGDGEQIDVPFIKTLIEE